MTNQTSVNNKRIAKNTLYLYMRMLLSLIVQLYTSRVILNALGISDYGIYNVVGGVVTMFSFMSGTMSTAAQRFIPNRSLEKVSCHFLMTAIRKTALYMLDL